MAIFFSQVLTLYIPTSQDKVFLQDSISAHFYLEKRSLLFHLHIKKKKKHTHTSGSAHMVAVQRSWKSQHAITILQQETLHWVLCAALAQSTLLHPRKAGPEPAALTHTQVQKLPHSRRSVPVAPVRNERWLKQKRAGVTSASRFVGEGSLNSQWACLGACQVRRVQRGRETPGWGGVDLPALPALTLTVWMWICCLSAAKLKEASKTCKHPLCFHSLAGL